jgi:hypothetical protein
MLQIKKGFLALSMLVFSGMNAMQLTHKGHDFFVETENQTFPIQRAFIDKELRGIDADKLSKLAAAGAYLKLNKMENSDDYSLRLGGRLNGAGPITANVLYWVTKSVCWGGVGAAATAGVATVAATTVATGGTAGVAVGAALNAGATVALAGTAGGSVAAGAVAAAVGTSAAATSAAGLATGAIASAGGAAGVVATIEAASVGAFAFGLLLPLP